MNMQVLDVKPNTDEWLELRLKHYTASEAAAMMGDSPYMSRNELLDLKKGWLSNPAGAFKEALYQSGHDSEAGARELMELDMCETLPAVVGARSIGGLELLASFDGLISEPPFVWEHKGWNLVLAENVMNGVLEPKHYWQLEHQCIVSGCDAVHFMTSDGGSENRKSFNYGSDPERRQQVIDGWKQFDKDLAKHQLEAKQELIPAKPVTQLPVIHCEVQGSKIITNIGDVIPQLEALSNQEMLRTLESDLDFTTKAAFNKSVKDARAKLKLIHSSTQGKFKDWSKFAEDVSTFDSILQKLQSHGEGQVRTDKAKRKRDIIEQGDNEVFKHANECTKRMAPADMTDFAANDWDFEESIKGMSSIDKMRDKISSEVANIKVKLTNIADLVSDNLLVLRETAKGHEFLFNDFRDIINQSTEAFTAIVKTRIAEHEASEQVKLDAERERIRKEEQEKAQQSVDADKKVDEFKGLVTKAKSCDSLESAGEVRAELIQMAPSWSSSPAYGDHTQRVLNLHEWAKSEIDATIEGLTPSPRLVQEDSPQVADPSELADVPVHTQGPGQHRAGAAQPAAGTEGRTEALVGGMLGGGGRPQEAAEQVTIAKAAVNLPQELKDALEMYCNRWYLNDEARLELTKLIGQHL